jgi:hypothetical protein
MMMPWLSAGGVTFKQREKETVHQGAGGLFLCEKALRRGMR